MPARVGQLPLRKEVTLVIWGLWVLAHSSSLAAAGWSFEPAIETGAEYDTNVRLTTGPHDSVWGATIAPELILNKETERTRVDLGLLLVSTQYSGDEVDDIDDQVLTVGTRQQITERASWGFDGSFIRDTLLRGVDTFGAPIDIPDVDLEDTDVALVQQRVRRERLRLRPLWTYALTPRTSGLLEYRFVDASFSDIGTTDLVDYDRNRILYTLSTRLTGAKSVNFVADVSRYRAPDANTETDNVSLLGGMGYAFSETLRGEFLVGVRETSFEPESPVDDTSGVVYRASLEKRSEVTALTMILRRDIDPTGVGESVETDELIILLRRELSPRLTFRFRADLFENKSLQVANVDRKYYEVEPLLRWQWTRSRFLQGAYRYRRNRRDIDQESADSNSVFFSVVFVGLR
ncbi:MAG: outer membrane beta-barrel protein [Acidiferrobacterales bacterium]